MTNLIAAFPNFVKALKIILLKLCREIIALCSEVHTNHLNVLCEQKVEFVFSILIVCKVTICLYRVKYTRAVLWKGGEDNSVKQKYLSFHARAIFQIRILDSLFRLRQICSAYKLDVCMHYLYKQIYNK